MPLVKTHIDESELYHDLKKMGRDNFTYEGAKALMEYLDQSDENIEYDPIALCCEYVEYETIYEVSENYKSAPQAEDFEYDDDSEYCEAVINWLNDNTTVICFDGGIIIQQF